ARQLGWSLGTLKRRLGQARESLRSRLARRGVTFSAALLATGLARDMAPAAVSPFLTAATVKAATAGSIPAPVAVPAQGALNAVAAGKPKLVTAVLLAVGLLAAGTGWLGHRVLADRSAAVAANLPAPAPTAAPSSDRPGAPGQAEAKKSAAPSEPSK